MPRILAATEGSTVSDAVLPHASCLARALEADLVVVRVLSPLLDCGDVFRLGLQEAVQVVSARWKEELTARMAEMSVPGDPVIEVRRREEEIHDSILRAAAEQDAVVAAMSSRGSSAVRHALLGSVALSVLNKTPIPLLLAGQRIAPPDAQRPDYHIVLTSDGSDDSLRAVEAVVPLSEHPTVRVTLLRIHAPRMGDRGDAVEIAEATADLDRLRSRFPAPDRVETVVRSIVRFGGIDSAIVQAATELRASVIALATHGHSRKYHVFAGGAAMGVLGQSPLPVLMVRSAPAAHAS